MNEIEFNSFIAAVRRYWLNSEPTQKWLDSKMSEHDTFIIQLTLDDYYGYNTTTPEVLNLRTDTEQSLYRIAVAIEGILEELKNAN
jgi:hypothetical protein